MAGRRILAIVLAGALLILVAATAAADENDDWAMEIAPGQWTGSARASVDTIAVLPGEINVDLRAQLKALFTMTVPIAVDGEPVAVTGDYSIAGPWRMEGLVSVGEGAALLVADMEMAGTGSVVGPATGPFLVGESRSKGTVTATIGGDAPVSFQQDNADDINALTLVVEASQCNEAHGRWDVSWNVQLEDLGWEPKMEGTWVAFRQEGFPSQEADAAIQEIAAWLTRGEVLFVLGAVDASQLTYFTNLRLYLADGERILNELRNLSQCELDLLGRDTVATYTSMITSTVLRLIAAAADRLHLSATQISHLVGIGLRTGALGAGSVAPQDAARAMAALHEDAVDVLANDFGPDDSGPCYAALSSCLAPTPPVQNILGLGTTLGWTIDLGGGETLPMVEVLAKGVEER